MAILSAIARLALVLAIVNAAVTLLVNPWRDDRPSERFPAIVQDVAVIAIFALVGTVLLRETLLTTSAVGAVVVGFALQDTLGNLFAGLAIQIEKPFRVGQWIALGPEREGQVQEITWRATKLRTKAGQFLIIPNSVIAKEPVLNYSEPTVPTRVDVEIGASYMSPPNDVKRAIHEALLNAPLVMKAPEPQVTIKAFGASSVDYLVQFWIEDYAIDRLARDQVRTNLWYTFRRQNIEIPYPIQVQYEREESPLRTDRHVASAAASLATVELFAELDEEVRHALAVSAAEHLFAAGETVVRQGAAGDSMFVVLRGRVRVQLEPSGQEVAVISAGGFFGEMSMLTGEARTATVRAIDDVTVLEISAADFRALAMSNPALLEHASTVVSTRKVGLDAARTSAIAAVTTETKQSFLARMKRFLLLKSEI
ncbi:MAG TPA: mechanosensitive ion channel family protein [Vicinamibacterales bacterium]|nr:mechanosensitive ion channel family protein [Vicinamibacterales bacterium]